MLDFTKTQEAKNGSALYPINNLIEQHLLQSYKKLAQRRHYMETEYINNSYQNPEGDANWP